MRSCFNMLSKADMSQLNLPQNDCRQWLSRSFRVHQICFWPGLRPQTPLRSLQHCPRLPSWFKGDPVSKGKGRVEGTAPYCKYLDLPV